MTPTVIPVFLNGRPARIALGATLSQLVAQEDPELAKAFAAAGAIFRVFGSARAAADPADA